MQTVCRCTSTSTSTMGQAQQVALGTLGSVFSCHCSPFLICAMLLVRGALPPHPPWYMNTIHASTHPHEKVRHIGTHVHTDTHKQQVYKYPSLFFVFTVFYTLKKIIKGTENKPKFLCVSPTVCFIMLQSRPPIVSPHPHPHPHPPKHLSSQQPSPLL